MAEYKFPEYGKYEPKPVPRPASEEEVRLKELQAYKDGYRAGYRDGQADA